jgi:hypothetical protein
MLFNSLYAQQSGVDIEQIIFLIQEKLNISALQQAWNRVTKRHPVLRTSFDWQSNNREPLQWVHRQVEIPWELQDWCGLSDEEQSAKLEAYLQCDRTLDFDLNIPPLMRLALFKVSESSYQLVWTFHHAILDGRSFTIVLEEVFKFYDAFCCGKDLYLPQPPSYQDHIQWLQQQDWSKSEDYWRKLLKGFSAPTPLLVDTIPSDKSGFGQQEIRLSKKITQMLESLAQEHQITLNTIVQGAWALLLSRYSGETDVVFGATRACRHSSVAGSESMVGLLINTLPVRFCVSPDKSLIPWLKELRSQWVELRNYEHTPLYNIQSCSEMTVNTPLFNSIVVFENQDLNTVLQSRGSRWKNLHFRLEEQTNFPLTLLAYGGQNLFSSSNMTSKVLMIPKFRECWDIFKLYYQASLLNLGKI